MRKPTCLRKIICFAFISLAAIVWMPVAGWSQHRKIDSLRQVLNGSKNEDTSGVHVLLALSKAYSIAGDSGNARHYTNGAMDLSRKLSFRKGEGDAWMSHSNIYFYFFNNEAAIPGALRALSIYKEINDNGKTGEAYLLLGAIYTMSELYSEAVQSSYSALGYFEKTGNKSGQADCLANIGFCYYYQDNFDHAYTAFSKALQLLKEAGKSFSYIGGHANVYLANMHLEKNEYDEAMQYDSTGFKIGFAIADHQVIANAYSCLGDMLIRKGMDPQFSADAATRRSYLDSALKKHYLSIDHALLAEDYNGSVDAYIRIADIYIKLGNRVKAQEFVDSAMTMATRVKTNDAYRHSYLAQSRVDSAGGNFREAYKHHQLWGIYRDNLLIEENKKRAVQAQLLFEYNKQQDIAKEAQLEKDAAAARTRNIQYAAIAIVLLIAAFLFWNSRQQQKAKAKIERAYAELKSTQAQLIQSEKMASLGQLTAGIAHEIQNPLNFVNNFSEINSELIGEMKAELAVGNTQLATELADDIRQNLEKINHHGKRADAIVKGMLQHSRTSTGHKQLADINALADEYLRLAYHGMRAKAAQHAAGKSSNTKLETGFDSSIGKINIIPQDIGRVLLNLYNNAFYAVREKAASFELQGVSYEPVIAVSTKKEGSRVLISVKDNGNGIPQDIIDKIFQPFFTTKPTGEGTGLGLSLSYDIIKAHGGELSVESRDGEGSEFTVVLPVG